MLQLLSPERVTNASTEPDRYVEASVRVIAPQPPTSAQERLGSIRIGWRDLAGETALSIRRLSQATVEQALEIGQRLLRMQRDLKRKEYATFLSVLGWASAKARKFINLAKTFSEFESSQLIGIELTTLLSLCSKKYQAVVAQLQETPNINQQLVDELVKETRTPRKPKQEPISGWKQSRSSGGRYYNVLLYSEEVGVSIEEQAEEEGILPQRVIEEAIALRAQHKSLAQPDQYSATHPEEQQTVVVDDARSLFPQNSSEGEELPRSDRTSAEFEERPAIAVAAAGDEVALTSDEVGENLETQVVALAKEQTADYGVEAINATTLSESASGEASAHPAQETASLAPSDNASTAECQLVTPPWQQLKHLRDAEGYVREIDTQIKALNSKLEIPNLDRQIEREIKGVLANRQKLRANKVSQIVNLADSNGIPADYEQLKSNGRIILTPEYASEALKQAKSWAEVVLVVGGDRDQLLKAVDSWTIEQRQILVQLLSTYLETEPSCLEHVAWIPKTLLQKVLTDLSFKIRKIGGPNNLVDDPKIEYVSNCNFISLEHPGTKREQWIFQDSDNKRYSVFGRDEIEIEKF